MPYRTINGNTTRDLLRLERTMNLFGGREGGEGGWGRGMVGREGGWGREGGREGRGREGKDNEFVVSLV